jgi:hypothetical protein
LVAVPLFAKPQSPAVTLELLCRLKNSPTTTLRTKIAKTLIKISRDVESL